MWRAIFIALGMMAIIIGLESLFIESANFYSARDTSASSLVNPTANPASFTREWTPQDWFPWTVLSGGAIVIIYAFTLPRRLGMSSPE